MLGDGRMLTHTISEYTKFINKIDHLASQLKKHDCTNGIFLKQGSVFQHNFNKAEIESVQNKHSSLARELNIIKERMQNYQRTFKGLKGKYISAGKREKIDEKQKCGRNDSKKILVEYTTFAWHIHLEMNFPSV